MNKPRELTGRHVAMIFGGAFSVIIAVNLTLATQAVRTFPGLEVKNSYVASQHFEAERAAQNALGWTVGTRMEDGILTLAITDADGPVAPEIVQATLGRATHVGEDRTLTFTFDGTALRAPAPGLGTGNWNLRLVAKADDGTVFKRRLVLRVGG
ncbi:MAG: FixH family protein [Pseudomonadota bacterium]